MKKTLFAIFISILIGCKPSNEKMPEKMEIEMNAMDTSKSFCMIDKDTSYILSYQFKKEVDKNGLHIYHYHLNDENNFNIIYDSIKNLYKEIFLNKDTLILHFEKEKIYTINGNDYNIKKLIKDKGVTDGEIIYLFDTSNGLLMSKSITWRIGKILCPDKNENDYVKLTALVYKIISDEEMSNSPIPASKFKFTRPVVE